MLAFAPGYAFATATGSAGVYLESLQQKARTERLADTRAWHALVHYEPEWLRPGVSSTVSTPWFFRAETGKHDPAAELAATLAAFFSARPITPRELPARCLYPARFAWLQEQLSIDASRLPAVTCTAYQQWLAALDPTSISLIFPAAFPNSPSSMFGHTLFRINSASRSKAIELLAYAVNFAASTDDAQGLMFAYKGLTGGYAGVYGVFPYYEKVKQYAWIENRDIWEYPLHLREAELKRLVAHLWELSEIEFDYYFFTKNCAYQLLSLLQVARPSLHLTEQFAWYAIPADTIRAIADVPGLLGEAHYRASLQTRLQWHARQLTEAHKRLALALARGDKPVDSAELAALSPRNQARVLEVAHDYLYYRFQNEAVPRQTWERRAYTLLLARSKLALSSGFKPVPAPETSPEEGHPTLRIAAGGVWEAGGFSLGFRIRPAYHDLLDDPGGYTDGAAINFFDLGLRLDPDSGELRIEDLTLISIVSLTPRSDLFQPVSWQLGTGLRRRPSSVVFDDVPNNLGLYAQGGPGLAWGDAGLSAYVFGLGSMDINSAFEPAYALGAGGSAGVLARPMDGWQLRAEIGALHYVAGDDGYFRWARLTQQWELAPGLGLRTEIGWENTAVGAGARAIVGLRAYF